MSSEIEFFIERIDLNPFLFPILLCNELRKKGFDDTLLNEIRKDIYRTTEKNAVNVLSCDFTFLLELCKKYKINVKVY